MPKIKLVPTKLSFLENLKTHFVLIFIFILHNVIKTDFDNDQIFFFIYKKNNFHNISFKKFFYIIIKNRFYNEWHLLIGTPPPKKKKKFNLPQTSTPKKNRKFNFLTPSHKKLPKFSESIIKIIKRTHYKFWVILLVRHP